MDKQGRVLIPIVLRSSAQMKGAVDIFDYLNYLEVLEPCPIPERSEKQSNYSAGGEDSEQTVLRPTISFGSRLEEQERTCPWKRMAIPGCTVDCMGIHAVDRAARLEVLEPVRLGARGLTLHAPK